MAEKLDVCPKCGWYEHGAYRLKECWPEGGAFAKELIAALPPGVEGTQLGYGHGHLAVSIGDATLVFDVGDDRMVRLDRVFGLYDLRIEDVVILAHAVGITRSRSNG